MINPAFLKPVRVQHSKNSSALKLPRYGVGVHFDDSSNDASGEAWFKHPQCGISYNRLYLDNGDVVSIADDDRAAWHFGRCLPPNNFNHTLYGLAAATNAHNPATKKCFASMCEDVARIFRFHAWPLADIDPRIIGHDEKAIFNPKDNPTRQDLWGKLGRRIDPTGFDAAKPILNIVQMQITVALLLQGKSADDFTPQPIVPAPAAVVVMRRLLKRGDTGADVMELQRLLGWPLARRRPTFGPATEADVKAFQKANGLPDDGKVGDNTRAALLRRA